MSPTSADDSGADRYLVERVHSVGDEAAFRTLYRRHTPAVYQYALRLVGGRIVDAEDVTQEVWMRAIRGLSRFRWESSLKTWLCRIALNVWRQHMRDRDPQWLALEDGRMPGPAPMDLASRLDLERALRLLPPGYRTVLLLHDWEGLTHDEIAKALGIGPGTSKSQLFHARARLRSLLGEPAT